MLTGTLDRDTYDSILSQQLAIIARDHRAIEIEKRSCADPEYFLQRHFHVEDINRPGKITTLVLTEIQKRLIREATDFNIVLKSRKPGVSTLIDALFFHRAMFRPHYRALIISHDREHTSIFMDRLRFAWERLPEWMRPLTDRDTRNEIVFRHNGSHIRGMTAGNAKIGRGSDIDDLHGSECSIWPDLKGVLLGAGEAMRPGGQVWLESTAHGRETFMQTYCDVRDKRRAGRAFFLAWPDDPRNSKAFGRSRERVAFSTQLTTEERAAKRRLNLSLEQIHWRRDKIENLGDDFAQEYPENDIDCFRSSGSPKFNVRYWTELLQVVMDRVRPVPPTIWVPKFRASMEIESDNFTMWQEPHEVCPCCGRREYYAIGADVAEGLPNGCYSHAGILRVTHLDRCEQVAEWHGKISPPEFGLLLGKIGRLYNGALVGIERNNHGHATNYALQRVSEYSPIYRHKEFDQRGNAVRKIGFPTTPGTRETLLSRFQQRVQANEHIVRSALLCRECADFQSGDEEKRDDASPRKGRDRFNDSVFGWSIADWIALKGGAIPVA